MLFDRIKHVFRTGRVVTASRRQQRRYPSLVEAQCGDGYGLHLSLNFRTSACNSANVARSALRRGFTTTSHCGPNSGSSKRRASRIRRLMRLRVTALPIARGTVSPIRGPARRVASPVSSTKAENRRAFKRAPLSYTRRNSLGLSSRLCFGNGRFERSGLLDSLGGPDGAFITHRQLPAALGAAARQHGLAVLGFHARPETVRLRTFAIIWLKSSLRHCVSCGCPGRRESPRIKTPV